METDLSSLPYRLCRPVLVLRDTPEHIDFHIKTGDYFDFIATAIGFFEEALSESAVRERALAEELRHDLHHVNAAYTIKPKDAQP